MAKDTNGSSIYGFGDFSFNKNASAQKSNLFSNDFNSTTSQPSLFNSDAQNQQINYSTQQTKSSDSEKPNNVWGQSIDAIVKAIGVANNMKLLELGNKQFNLSRNSFNTNQRNYVKTHNINRGDRIKADLIAAGHSQGSASYTSAYNTEKDKTSLTYRPA